MRDELQLQPPPASIRLWMAGLGLVLPVVILTVALAAVPAEQQKLVGGSPALTFALLAAVLLPVWLVLDWSLRRHRLRLDADGLEVATSFYRRRLSLSQLQLDQARVVNLDERPEFRPTFKSNGASVPGFKSGWFRLRGRHKALVAILGGPRVLWLPTTQGYGLLLQPVRPEALLQRLRELAAAGTHG